MATPTLSVDAFHARLIWVVEVGVAVKAVGVVGAVVSGAGVVDPPVVYQFESNVVAVTKSSTVHPCVLMPKFVQ